MLSSQQRQGFWNVDGATQVPWVSLTITFNKIEHFSKNASKLQLNMANINNDNQRYQQQLLLQGNEQPDDKNKEKKKRKQHHTKNQGQIINPRNLPGLYLFRYNSIHFFIFKAGLATKKWMTS
jgi:hypothetical protein